MTNTHFYSQKYKCIHAFLKINLTLMSKIRIIQKIILDNIKHLRVLYIHRKCCMNSN